MVLLSWDKIREVPLTFQERAWPEQGVWFDLGWVDLCWEKLTLVHSRGTEAFGSFGDPLLYSQMESMKFHIKNKNQKQNKGLPQNLYQIPRVLTFCPICFIICTHTWWLPLILLADAQTQDTHAGG